MNHTDTILPFLLNEGMAQHHAEAYCARVMKDYEEILPFLPPRATRFLDIGCGHGGHALYLADHYGSNVQALLIEGGVAQPKTKESGGFREQCVPWLSGAVSMQMIKSMHPRAILYPVNEETADLKLAPCDLIVSFASWGHHYPVATYLSLVQHCLKRTGRIVMDIRHGTDGLTVMEAGGFGVEATGFHQARKFDRFVFVRKK